MGKRVRMCANCKHWERLAGNRVCPCGVCKLTKLKNGQALCAGAYAVAKPFDGYHDNAIWTALVTRPDFACSQFEKVEP